MSTPAGILIDRYGGRLVMAAGSLLCGTGFILLSRAQSALGYVAAWTVLGLAMSAVLYEAAFATLIHRFGAASRLPITTLTLFGGFASTVFWPLTLVISARVGWRDTFWYYGLLQLLLCLPLHLLLEGGAAAALARRVKDSADLTLRQALRHPAFWTLAFAFACNSFIFSGLSVHLIPILHGFGHPMQTVVLMAALIGPLQVAYRIGEMALGDRVAPQTVGKLCFAALPGALLALLFFGRASGDRPVLRPVRPVERHPDNRARHRAAAAVRGAHHGAHLGRWLSPSLLAKAALPARHRQRDRPACLPRRSCSACCWRCRWPRSPCSSWPCTRGAALVPAVA
ncbi:MFS transporter [Massilia sp. B-10]|nr:MFS transporter [Massilia sp. B-10]